MKLSSIFPAIVAVLFLSAGLVSAADQEQIYGSQLMTKQERFEYHEKMSKAKTNEERERIRNEHHKQMVKRAKAQGKKLPDMPGYMGRDGHMGGGGDMGGGGYMGGGGGGGGGGGR